MLIRQFLASYHLAVHRLARSRFLFVGAGLAAIPLVIAFLLILPLSGSAVADLRTAHQVFETFYRTLFLHFVVFFVGSVFGFAVVRQENDDQTLHHILLQPIPRWVLLLGKVGAFWSMAALLCVASLWLTYLTLILGRFGLRVAVADLFADGRAESLAKESLVIVLGLLAYGSIAMLMGSFFKSGFYAVLLITWEAGLPYLPTTIKFWTIMHYLQSLSPNRADAPSRFFDMLGEPASTALSLAVLLGLSLAIVALCLVVFQARECMYTES